jgi:hypothetical protein
VLRSVNPDLNIYGTFEIEHFTNTDIHVEGKCWYYDIWPEDKTVRGSWNSIYASFEKKELRIFYKMEVQREMINGKLEVAPPGSSYIGVMRFHIVQGQPPKRVKGSCVGSRQESMIFGSIEAQVINPGDALSSDDIVKQIWENLDENVFEKYPINRSIKKILRSQNPSIDKKVLDNIDVSKIWGNASGTDQFFFKKNLQGMDYYQYWSDFHKIWQNVQSTTPFKDFWAPFHFEWVDPTKSERERSSIQLPEPE